MLAVLNDKQKFLGLAVTVFKVMGWIAVGLGILSFIVIMIGGGTAEAPRVTGLLGLLLGAIYFFIFFTASHVIGILLEIAENTRKSSV